MISFKIRETSFLTADVMAVHGEALALKSHEGTMKESLFLRWEGVGGWWVGASLGKKIHRGRKPSRYEWLILSGEFMSDVSSKRPFMTSIKNTTLPNHRVTITPIFVLFLAFVTCKKLPHSFIYRIVYLPDFPYPSLKNELHKSKHFLYLVFCSFPDS